ncbi:MAG: magnesium transporter [Candidatus Saccharimonadales bacterium]|jgi:magnesium transporter
MQTNFFRNVRSHILDTIDSPKRGSWVRVVDPSKEDLQKLEKKFDLDVDLLADGIDLYEAPRIEQDNGSLYIYVRFCRPTGQYTSTHPLLIVVMPDMLMTVSRIESEPINNLVESGTVVTTQKLKVVLQILEELNRGYRAHLNGVTKKILSTRSRLQRTIVSNDDILNFIDVEEDLNEFLAALQPYGIVLHALLNGKYMKLHEEDEDLIEDLQLSASELVELTKSRLKTIQNIREAYNTIASNDLNKVFKRLTSIAIFMAIPTIISGFYGMNVVLPLADDPNAFWLVAGLTLVIMIIFILFFRKKKWL